VQNADFLRFVAHWGFRVRACRPYRAKTKGKVERSIRYVRGSLFYARDFVREDDLNAQTRTWLLSRANVRKHRTTGERPLDRFTRDEQMTLLALAPRPYRSLILTPRAAPARTMAGPRTAHLFDSVLRPLFRTILLLRQSSLKTYIALCRLPPGI